MFACGDWCEAFFRHWMPPPFPSFVEGLGFRVAVLRTGGRGGGDEVRPLNCFLSHARGLNSLQFKQKWSPANSCYFFIFERKTFFSSKERVTPHVKTRKGYYLCVF